MTNTASSGPLMKESPSHQVMSKHCTILSLTSSATVAKKPDWWQEDITPQMSQRKKVTPVWSLLTSFEWHLSWLSCKVSKSWQPTLPQHSSMAAQGRKSTSVLDQNLENMPVVCWLSCQDGLGAFPALSTILILPLWEKIQVCFAAAVAVAGAVFRFRRDCP